MIKMHRKFASSLIKNNSICKFFFFLFCLNLKLLVHNQCSTLRFDMSSIDCGNLVCKTLKFVRLLCISKSVEN